MFHEPVMIGGSRLMMGAGERKQLPAPTPRPPHADDRLLIKTERMPSRDGAMRLNLYGERGRDGSYDLVPAEMVLVKAIARVLYAEYPGHPWSVEVMMDQGVAMVGIPALLGFNYGYILHLNVGTERRDIVDAGGEILERFKIPRSTIDIGAYIEAEDRIPLLGNFRASRANRLAIPT